jgi:hypothetical protein
MSATTRNLRQQRQGHQVANATTTTSSGTTTIHVPLAFRQRRGRKVLVGPNLAGAVTQTVRTARQAQAEVTPAVRVLARAFRWRSLIETGTVNTVNDIAGAENINPSYVSRVLRLTLLAPEVVEALMMMARTADAQSLNRLTKPFPVEWQMHGSLFGRNDDRLGA